MIFNNYCLPVISIHPLRREWDHKFPKKAKKKGISIHPLRREWDEKVRKRTCRIKISIHPLRREWDFVGFE